MKEVKPQQRTDIDWTKHEVHVEETSNCIIHFIKKPDTYHDCVKFINAGGVMSVTGDYGNWMFCRNFTPCKEADYTSGGYWSEKLRISSTQNPYEFDKEATDKRISEMIEEYQEGTRTKDRDEALEYLYECLATTQEGDELYKAYAYTSYPSNWDCEGVPYEQTFQYWFKAILDAYDEIVFRYKSGSLI